MQHVRGAHEAERGEERSVEDGGEEGGKPEEGEEGRLGRRVGGVVHEGVLAAGGRGPSGEVTPAGGAEGAR